MPHHAIWLMRTELSRLRQRSSTASAKQTDASVIFPDGSSFQGSLNVAGFFTGEGVYTSKTGHVLRGTWVDGNLEGKATFSSATGEIVEGSFTQGELMGGTYVRNRRGDTFFCDNQMNESTTKYFWLPSINCPASIVHLGKQLPHAEPSSSAQPSPSRDPPNMSTKCTASENVLQSMLLTKILSNFESVSHRIRFFPLLAVTPMYIIGLRLLGGLQLKSRWLLRPVCKHWKAISEQSIDRMSVDCWRVTERMVSAEWVLDLSECDVSTSHYCDAVLCCLLCFLLSRSRSTRTSAHCESTAAVRRAPSVHSISLSALDALYAFETLCCCRQTAALSADDSVRVLLQRCSAIRSVDVGFCTTLTDVRQSLRHSLSCVIDGLSEPCFALPYHARLGYM